MISIQRIMKIHPKIKEIKEGKSSEHTQYNNSVEITLGTCSQNNFQWRQCGERKYLLHTLFL